jgi:hypothetical protein
MKPKARETKAKSGKMFETKRKAIHRAKHKPQWSPKAMIHQGILAE